MKNTLKTISIALSVVALFTVSTVSHAKKDRFSKLDSNADGKISLAEYTEASKKPEKAPKRFARFDTDADGFLSKEEVSAGSKKKGKKNKKNKKNK